MVDSLVYLLCNTEVGVVKRALELLSVLLGEKMPSKSWFATLQPATVATQLCYMIDDQHMAQIRGLLEVQIVMPLLI